MPTADVAVKIAQALGVTVEYLVTGKETQPKQFMLASDVRALVQNFKLLKENDRKMIISIVQLYKKMSHNG